MRRNRTGSAQEVKRIRSGSYTVRGKDFFDTREVQVWLLVQTNYHDTPTCSYEARYLGQNFTGKTFGEVTKQLELAVEASRREQWHSFLCVDPLEQGEWKPEGSLKSVNIPADPVLLSVGTLEQAQKQKKLRLRSASHPTFGFPREAKLGEDENVYLPDTERNRQDLQKLQKKLDEAYSAFWHGARALSDSQKAMPAPAYPCPAVPPPVREAKVKKSSKRSPR